MPTLKFGSYQGPIAENEPKKNIAKVKEILEGNAELDFLCFPESYISGYMPKSIQGSAVELSHDSITELIAFTKDFDTVLLVGMSERIGDDIFNTVLIIHRGELIGKQRKTMLCQGNDSTYFTPDHEVHVFNAKGIKFAVAICHTTSFVEPALLARLKGARVLFTPHYNNIAPQLKLPNGEQSTYHSHREMVLNNQAALATLLKMVVIRSNIVVIEQDALGSGDSNIWDMNGRLVAEGQPFTECVVKHEFDLEIFKNEHWIDRRELPLSLYEDIYRAAQKYEGIK